MALFELKQHYADTEEKWTAPAFKECAVADIHLAFFNGNEHAENRKVDGKTALVVVEESTLKVRSSHWEAGAKQNFDTGLYTAYTILYIQAKDYGPKPKVGKQLVLKGSDNEQCSIQRREHDNYR
jgi:hypothetical protein